MHARANVRTHITILACPFRYHLVHASFPSPLTLPHFFFLPSDCMRVGDGGVEWSKGCCTLELSSYALFSSFYYHLLECKASAYVGDLVL